MFVKKLILNLREIIKIKMKIVENFIKELETKKPDEEINSILFYFRNFVFTLISNEIV